MIQPLYQCTELLVKVVKHNRYGIITTHARTHMYIETEQ